jgi:hypothetical protein
LAFLLREPEGQTSSVQGARGRLGWARRWADQDAPRSRAKWFTPVIPAVERLRQEDPEFETARPCPKRKKKRAKHDGSTPVIPAFWEAEIGGLWSAESPGKNTKK